MVALLWLNNHKMFISNMGGCGGRDSSNQMILYSDGEI